MTIVFFEDKHVVQLYPITLTRPAFDIFCGGQTLFSAAKEVFEKPKTSFIVREYLKKLSLKRYNNTKLSLPDNVIFLNSRIVPDIKTVILLKKMVSGPKAFMAMNKNTLCALYVPKGETAQIPLKTFNEMDFKNIESLLARWKAKKIKVAWETFDYVHHTIQFNRDTLKSNLGYMKRKFQEVHPGVYVGKKVHLDNMVFYNTTFGDIIIDDRSAVLPFTYLVGPLYIGKNCQVNEHASIEGSSIGNVCKVGGEISNTVFAGHSNKQHFGCIGESYIGEWVNLGAGTTNSDLKNTYGEITMDGVNTGQRHLGCVIGDNTKTAILCSLYTGKIIGVNSCLYGRVTRDVASFTNYDGDTGQMAEFYLGAAEKTQKIMMRHRGVGQTKLDIRLLEGVFRLTQEERDASGVKKGKFNLK